MRISEGFRTLARIWRVLTMIDFIKDAGMAFPSPLEV